MKRTIQLNNETKLSAAGPSGRRTQLQIACLLCCPDTMPLKPPTCVHDQLAAVTNWQERARTARYRAKTLAKLCSASLRELERFFHFHTGHGPHHWLNELRQTEALALVAAGHLIKHAASDLYYPTPAHFSRDFKRFHGLTPTAAQNITALPSLLGQTVRRLLVAHCRVLVGVHAGNASQPCSNGRRNEKATD
jgi:AraC-like DNA-binding protein